MKNKICLYGSVIGILSQRKSERQRFTDLACKVEKAFSAGFKTGEYAVNSFTLKVVSQLLRRDELRSITSVPWIWEVKSLGLFGTLPSICSAMVEVHTSTS